MDPQELKNLGVSPWNEVEPNFNGRKLDILTGNGLSMSFSTDFAYKSLFDVFVNSSSSNHIPILQQFNTSNFEEMMLRLKHADEVNTLFGKKYDEIDEAITCLRDGLIEAVRQVHPSKGNLNDQRLSSLTDFLGRFENVFTTNYDAITYYLILGHNDQNKADQFSDYFYGTGRIAAQKDFKGIQALAWYRRRVYYLHGALFIFRGQTGEYKRTVAGSLDLLDSITEEISSGNIPLFVSEGSADEKLNTISKSGYLAFCLHQLRISTNPILVYGLSLGVQDKHLLDAIVKQSRDILFAVYTHARSTKEDIELQKATLRKDIVDLNGDPDLVTFVDSNSIV